MKRATTGWQIYQWRGEPIADIEQWAADRGEKMVEVTFRAKDVNPFARRAKDAITYHKEIETMPESFWQGFRWEGDKEKIKEVRREPRTTTKQS